MTEQNDYLPLTEVNWIEDYPEVVKWLREDHKKVTGILPHRSTVVWNLNHMAKHNPGESSISGLVDRVANRYRKARSISAPMNEIPTLIPFPTTTPPVIPDNVSVETLIEALAEVVGCEIQDLTSSFRPTKPSPFDYVDIAPGKPDEIGETFWIDMLITRARSHLNYEEFFPDNPITEKFNPNEEKCANPEKEGPECPNSLASPGYAAIELREGDSLQIQRAFDSSRVNIKANVKGGVSTLEIW